MNFKDFREKLKQFRNNRIVMVGIGNSYRRDDNAGQVLLNKIIETNTFEGTTFILAHTTPENHLSEIITAKPDIVVFFDAIKMGNKAGEVTEIPSDNVADKGFSTHSYSIKLVEQYLRNEDVKHFMYIGIEPEIMQVGEGLSKSVQNGISRFFN